MVQQAVTEEARTMNDEQRQVFEKSMNGLKSYLRSAHHTSKKSAPSSMEVMKGFNLQKIVVL